MAGLLAPKNRIRGNLTQQFSIDLIPRWRHEKSAFSPRETNLKQKASPKADRKSIGSRSKKRKRLRAARRTDFRSSGWYEKAALSIGISARA
jgi:hypothetical protein